jgi:hypothetical protein
MNEAVASGESEPLLINDLIEERFFAAFGMTEL